MTDLSPFAIVGANDPAKQVSADRWNNLLSALADAIDAAGGAVSVADVAGLQAALDAKLSTSDSDERVRDAVGTALVAGSGITITPNDGADTITLAASGGFDPLRLHQTAAIIPMWNSATLSGNTPGFNVNNAGITAKAFATTNLRTSMKRVGVETSSVAGSQAYIYGSSGLVWRGNAAGLGGFVVEYLFAIEQQAANGRGWFGLAPAATWAATDSASAKTDIIGVGWDTGDTQLQLMTNDASGTATKTALGASFPISANAVYRVRLSTAANGSTISYVVNRLDTAATASGTASADLPTSTQNLTFHAWASNGGTAAQQILNLVGMTCFALNGQA